MILSNRLLEVSLSELGAILGGIQGFIMMSEFLSHASLRLHVTKRYTLVLLLL